MATNYEKESNYFDRNTYCIFNIYDKCRRKPQPNDRAESMSWWLRSIHADDTFVFTDVPRDLLVTYLDCQIKGDYNGHEYERVGVVVEGNF